LVLRFILFTFYFLFYFVGTAEAKRIDVTSQAKEIYETSGIKGGFVVHPGSGDGKSPRGKLTASLCSNDIYLVHGLDADLQNVEKARTHIQQLVKFGLSLRRSGTAWPQPRVNCI